VARAWLGDTTEWCWISCVQLWPWSFWFITWHRRSQDFVWVHFSTQSWRPFLLVAFKRWCTFFLKKLTTFLVVASKKGLKLLIQAKSSWHSKKSP